MPLATALSSGLQAFTTVRNERRKGELHNLQAEGLSLRNEGYRLGNEFDRATYDDRVGTVTQGHRRATADASTAEWKERFAASQTAVQEALQPHQIREGIATADLRQQQVATEGQRTRLVGSQAIEHEQSRASNIAKAEADANNAQLKYNVAAAEAVRGELATTFQNLGGFGPALNSPEAHGQAVAYANEVYSHLLRPNQQIGGFVEIDDGQFAIVDTDGNPITNGRMSRDEEDAAGASDDERAVRIFTERELVDAFVGDNAKDTLAAGAQTRYVQGVQRGADQATVASAEQQVEQATGTAESYRESAETSREVNQTLSQLNERFQALKVEEASLVGQARAGVREGQRARVERLSELRAELDSIEAAKDTLAETHEGPLSRDADNWEADAAEEEARIPEIRRRAGQTLSNNAALTRQAEQLALVNDTTPAAALSSLTGRNLPGSMTPTEQREDQLAGARHARDMNDIALGGVDAVINRLANEENLDPRDLNQTYATVLESVRRSSSRTDNNLYDWLTSSNPREQLGANTLLALAATQQARGGPDAGQYIRGTLENWSPGGIDLAGKFVNDERFTSEVPSDIRLRTVERAVAYYEQGRDKTDAGKQLAMNRAMSELNDYMSSNR